MNRIRAVLLDAGGTLIHLDPPIILQALAAQGLERDEVAFARADRLARAHVSERLREGHVDDRTRWQIWARALLTELGGDDALVAAVRSAVAANGGAARLWTRTLAGTADALAELRAAGFILGVVSNSDGSVASYLAAAGLADSLDFIVDSGEFGLEKPDPRIFLHACALADVPPQHALYVGDVYEVDVLGARAAGMPAVLVDPDDLVPDADCPRLPDVRALPAWLGVRARA